MKNSEKVQLYVYTTVEDDGSESYSYPFCAVDDASAIRFLAHTLASYKFHCNTEFNVGHLYCFGSLVYCSSFNVSSSCIDDLSYFYAKDEVQFDLSHFLKLFNIAYDYLSTISKKDEEKPNA